MKKVCTMVIVLSLFIPSLIFSQKESTERESEVIKRLKANLEFLADDALEGRNASSMGEKIAARFIKTELEKNNIKPFGDNETYFQNFNVKVRRLSEEPKVPLIDKSGNVLDYLTPGPDFIVDDSKIFDSLFMKKNAEIVFAGYGITAEEYGYDDYKNIDVKGKIVMLLAGEPVSEDSNFFKGKDPTPYSSGANKTVVAEKKGAVGLIVLMPDGVQNLWHIYNSMMMTGDMKFMDENHSPAGGLPYIMMTLEGAEKILKGENLSIEEVKKIRTGEIKSRSCKLNKQTGFYFDVLEREESIQNVIGIIEGNDPQLKNEFIVISAHYDHVGVYDGDVCNGANDNGSGTVAILELAKRFSEEKKNKRSVIFAFFTAEEKGLVGAQYFVHNFGQLNNVIANINIDMCSRGDENTIYTIGADRTSTEFAKIIETANSETVKMNLDNSLSNTINFKLSDHYPFALNKIPALFLFDNFLEGLHGPEDEVQYVNFNKINKTINLTERIVDKISELNHRLVFDGKVDNH